MHKNTSDKGTRLNAIVSVIESGEISTQEELLNELEGMGISCTQATLSRNLRQLRAARVPSADGRMVYRLQEGDAEADGKANRISDTVRGHVWANGMIVIKTLPGFAGAIAIEIDRASPDVIAGTIAGDDTILVIPADGFSNDEVMGSIRFILPGAAL
jgi:transcriptional regulator of arginine metabolism